jgi:hypothetical protein
LNHAAVDSGIPRESATQRIGIMRSSKKLRYSITSSARASSAGDPAV